MAGVQVLVRPLPALGAIGYLPKGPLFAFYDPALVEMMFAEIHRVSKVYRITSLFVQPPNNGVHLSELLPSHGFQPTSIAIAQPTATLLIDLSKELDAILAGMKSKTRYAIRLGRRKGITTREGTARDIPTFHHLLMETGKRQDFTPPDEEFFVAMARLLGRHGHFKLFLAEYQGEALAALLAVPFGDTVIYKRGAWSGRHGNLHPNEALHWAAIRWAKTQGYHHYDLEGIDPGIAAILTRGDSPPGPIADSVSRFKLGFGGRVTLLPGIFVYIYNPFLRWVYRTIYPKIAGWPVMERLMNDLSW